MTVIRSVTAAIVLTALLFGCATSAVRESPPAAITPSQSPESEHSLDTIMRDLAPRSGKPLFLGISPRLHNRNDEEARAVLHAAEQASRYTRMSAEYRLVTQRGGGSIGYLEDIRADWDADFADRLVDSAEITQTVQDENGTYVLATFDGIPPAPAVNIERSVGEGEPEWVARPPDIPGFLVTVGVTRRSRRLRDSIDTADEEALKEILLQARSTIRMMEDRRDVERVGTLETTTAAQEAAAVLRQYLVLARYAPPDGQYYYSLVIAREE